jgi:hypothetical protein
MTAWETLDDAEARQFLGFSAASGLAIYYLQQEAKLASSLLMASVEELQQGTGKVSPSLLRQ